MSNKHPSPKSAEQGSATLDALLQKGVQADQRATKPAAPPTMVTPPEAPQRMTPKMSSPVVASPLERLTVRFTQNEARLLERARTSARIMGYKISDTAVFRLALNAFEADRMTPQAIEAVLVADGRRSTNKHQSTR